MHGLGNIPSLTQPDLLPLNVNNGSPLHSERRTLSLVNHMNTKILAALILLCLTPAANALGVNDVLYQVTDQDGDGLTDANDPSPFGYLDHSRSHLTLSQVHSIQLRFNDASGSDTITFTPPNVDQEPIIIKVAYEANSRSTVSTMTVNLDGERRGYQNLDSYSFSIVQGDFLGSFLDGTWHVTGGDQFHAFYIHGKQANIAGGNGDYVNVQPDGSFTFGPEPGSDGHRFQYIDRTLDRDGDGIPDYVDKRPMNNME